MKISRELVVNKGYCPHCKDELQSNHRHDFVMCSCGKSGLDGGLSYIRVIGDTITEPLYLYDDFEVIRKYHCRGGRGKNGDQPLTWTPICEMESEWLGACILYNKERGMEDKATTKLYQMELNYRIKNN